MAFKITDSCNNCRACEPECPNQAISEGPDIFLINPDKCTECVTFHDSPRCAAVCPVEACITDEQHPETEAQLVEKVKKFYPNKEISNNFPSHFRS